jgi:hypothetical protein
LNCAAHNRKFARVGGGHFATGFRNAEVIDFPEIGARRRILEFIARCRPSCIRLSDGQASNVAEILIYAQTPGGVLESSALGRL